MQTFLEDYVCSGRITDQGSVEINCLPLIIRDASTGETESRKSLQFFLDTGTQAQQKLKGVSGDKLILPIKGADSGIIGLIQQP